MKKLQWTVDYQHIAIAIAAALVGGATGYFAQQNPLAFLASFDTWAHAKPILLGFVYAEIVAVLALAKKSFVEKTPDAPPPTPGKVEFLRRSVPPPPVPPPGAVISNMPSSFPKDRRTMVAVLFLAACTPLLGGCSPKWWTDFKNNPVQVASQFASFVEAFIQGTMTVWALIAPALGGGAQSATALFNEAVLALNNTLGLLLDAIHTAVDAATPAPDFSKLIADVKDAVARVMAIVAQFKGATPSQSIAAGHDHLLHQATVIGAWRT